MSWPNSAYDPDCPGDDRPNDDSPGDYPGDYHPDKDYPGDGISWKSRQVTRLSHSGEPTHPSQPGAPTHPSQPGELKHHLKPGQPHYIPVSTIVRSSVCPVRVYLERFEPIEEPFQYTVAKQVGYHLGGGAHLKSDAGWNHHTGADLDARSIWEEIRLVRPDINDEMFSYLEACVAACRGIDQNPHWDPPVAIDVPCKHKKYAISGRIDWLFDTHPEIGILRATRAPTHGVWKQDRIRAAAYLLAAEELEMPGPPGGIRDIRSAGFFWTFSQTRLIRQTRYRHINPFIGSQDRLYSIRHRSESCTNCFGPEIASFCAQKGRGDLSWGNTACTTRCPM